MQTKAWELTDAFWEAVKDLLVRPTRKANKKYLRHSETERKLMDFRKALGEIFYVLRTGRPGGAVPKEWGAPSAIYQYFQLWTI
jgi:transposase